MATGIDLSTYPSYCTDEDIAIESADYSSLAENDIKYADFLDGMIQVSDPWTVYSPGSDFLAYGLRSGHILQMTAPIDAFRSGEQFAVDSVITDDPHRLKLRRKGMLPGQGVPPGGGRQVWVNVAGVCTSLDALIRSASREMDDRLGITEALLNQRTVTLAPTSTNVMTESCVALVLARAYMSKSVGTNVPGAKEVYMEKSKFYQDRFDNRLTMVIIRFSDERALQSSLRWRRIHR